MIVHSIFFYFFSVIAIFSSLMVITSRSTINSVFFLILDFISVGCLFIMVGAEFLGMILLIVYVGAVAVLFLFVVMMLNVSEQKQSWFIGKKSTHIPTGLIVSILIYYFKDLSIALGKTDRIPLIISIWVPIITLFFFNLVGVLQINEK